MKSTITTIFLGFVFLIWAAVKMFPEIKDNKSDEDKKSFSTFPVKTRVKERKISESQPISIEFGLRANFE